jgi:subtilisin family serine protease
LLSRDAWHVVSGATGAPDRIAAWYVDPLSVSGAGGHPSRFTGTSAAHLGGLAALLLEIDPGLDRAELRSVLRRTAVPVGDENIYGAGRVDPVAAARRIRERRGARG